MDSSHRHISHLPEHQLGDSGMTVEHLQSEQKSAMQITECFSSFNPQNHPLQSAKGSLFPSPLFAWERTNNPARHTTAAALPLIRFRYLESGSGVIFQSALPSSSLSQCWCSARYENLQSLVSCRVPPYQSLALDLSFGEVLCLSCDLCFTGIMF